MGGVVTVDHVGECAEGEAVTVVCHAPAAHDQQFYQ